jgi:sugar lactone lactonase YvrE
VFIADRVNDSIRTVDVDGGFTLTLASGFDGPGGLALDGGLLFVADTFNHTIKSVDVDSGVVNLVAGRPGVAGGIDGDLATATLDSPQALALVGRTVLVAGFDGAVRAIDLDAGTIATIATGVGFFAPFLADGDGVLGADLDGAVVRIGTDGAIYHVAGPRAPVGYADGDGVDARFALPACVVIDGDAAIVSDGDNAAIRRVDLATGAVTTLLGHPDFPGDTDGPRQDARLAFPAGLARADDGDLLIVDNGAGTLRRLDVATDTVTTVATGLDDPWEVAVVDADRAVVVEAAAGRLSVVALGDGTVTPLATDLAFPVGVAVIDDRVFVSENEGHTIVEVALADGTVTTFLGTAGFQGSADGDAAVALLNFPAGLDARIEDGAPVLYVAETGGQTIRRVDVASRESRFVVGDPFLSGALPAGSRVALDGAPILNPNDVAVLDGVGGSDVVIVGDTTVVVARP